MTDALGDQPHRRFNPLKRDWVLVSPQRNKRPWQGKVERANVATKPKHDPQCYLCAGNQRVTGARNPEYVGPYVFSNDFPAILPDTAANAVDVDGLLHAETVTGEARVICFSERHDLTLPELTDAEIRQIVDLWADQIDELKQTYRYVQIFENKGETMGCSNPHPHGQIWATDFIPSEVVREDECQKAFMAETGKVLLLAYAETESADGARMVVENNDWIAVVPYWAAWPFETLVLPKRHVVQLSELVVSERHSLAEILKELCCKYDNLYQTEFPYSMGWHGAPHDHGSKDHWQLHAHFYPPLLRSASVRKFMVGFEMLAEAQRDLTPETAAAQLRELDTIHYKALQSGEPHVA